VDASEVLHSLVMEPGDIKMNEPELWFTFITHAEAKGMSVLRGAAPDDEFLETARLRLERKPGRKVHGVASVDCVDIRQLLAADAAPGRSVGERLYCVLDTDAERRPHHADVFATVPHSGAGVTNKTAWRPQRRLLMELMRRDVVSAGQFRGGILSAPNAD
jgi:hypothetical protein